MAPHLIQFTQDELSHWAGMGDYVLIPPDRRYEIFLRYMVRLVTYASGTCRVEMQQPCLLCESAGSFPLTLFAPSSAVRPNC
jgi:hypothetical protein